MNTVDVFQNMIHKFDQQTISTILNKINKDYQIEENDTSPLIEQHQVEDKHLIFFDFTKNLSSDHRDSTKLSKKTIKSLFKLLISSIDKYGPNNVKILLNINQINHNIMNKNKICNDRFDDEWMSQMVDTKQLIQHKIDIISINSKHNDMDSHFNYIINRHLKRREQCKYRKISILNVDDKQTNHKYT